MRRRRSASGCDADRVTEMTPPKSPRHPPRPWRSSSGSPSLDWYLVAEGPEKRGDHRRAAGENRAAVENRRPARPIRAELARRLRDEAVAGIEPRSQELGAEVQQRNEDAAPKAETMDARKRGVVGIHRVIS